MVYGITLEQYKIENDKNSIKSIFASPMPTDLISIRSIHSATILGLHASNKQTKKNKSLQQNKSKPKKFIIQWFVYDDPNLRANIPLDILKCENMRYNMVETFVQLNSNSNSNPNQTKSKKKHNTNKKVQLPNRIGMLAGQLAECWCGRKHNTIYCAVSIILNNNNVA